MTQHLAAALFCGAAVYRIVISITHSRTIWRTSFTVCVGAVALATLSSFYGSLVEHLLGVWNLSILVTHLLLIVAAAAVMIYVATLRHPIYTLRTIAGPGVVAALVIIVQVLTWVFAPLHDRQLVDLRPVSHSPSVALFNGSFLVMIFVSTAATARFSLLKASSRNDLTRTVSLLLTGAACVLGSCVFALYAAVTVLRYANPGHGEPAKQFADALVPVTLLVLALGTLTLLLAPRAVEFAQALSAWRSLRPLWNELVHRYPEVQLATPAAGGWSPRRRLQNRVQRMRVEIYDALRLADVSVETGAGVVGLTHALQLKNSGGGEQLGAHSAQDLSASVLNGNITEARSYPGRS